MSEHDEAAAGMTEQARRDGCGACAFFAVDPGRVGESGFCRRRPPKSQIIGMNKTGEPVINSSFPAVPRNWWCGEWAKRIEISN